MQRRITLALMGIALAAVLLVGVGVLGFASIGAERDARERVETQLDAIAELVDDSSNGAELGPAISRLAESFDNSTVAIAVLAPNGELVTGRRSPSRNLGPELDEGESEQVLGGGVAFTRVGGQVRGVQALDSDFAPNGQAVAVIRRDVATISGQARLWFVLSSGIVLAGAAIAAAALARRFVEPIRRATAATGSIAGGDLAVRVPVEGRDELAELGTSINSMAAELERGRAAEQQFLLSVSHDLRTPLTALRGFGEALEDGTVTDPAKAGAVISHNANRLGRLVGDLLDLSKLEAKQFRLDIQNFDAAEVVTATAEGLTPLAAERGIQIVVSAPEPVVVTADPDRLGQAVANLVENAVSFARSTVHVEVRAGTTYVMITVTDDGPGIAPEDLPHVFERLYVTKLVPERSESASGLGLAIVRELTNAMGGRVDAVRPAEGGTSMVVQLPLATATT